MRTNKPSTFMHTIPCLWSHRSQKKACTKFSWLEEKSTLVNMIEPTPFVELRNTKKKNAATAWKADKEQNVLE